MPAGLSPVPLSEAADESAFGGKAVSLCAAVRAGLPVPPGTVLSVQLVDAIAAGDRAAVDAVVAAPQIPDGPLAVRSSAVGEDSGTASFAGQHATILNVNRAGLPAAVRTVWESARSPAALSYRAHRGIIAVPHVAVVVQQLLEPIAAGVLFTRDPVTGADERIVEAAWGLGEAVVGGLVVPDRYRFDRQGRLIEQVSGHKDVRVVRDGANGTVEVPVPEALRAAPCLTAAHLGQFHELVERCVSEWGPHLDIEWALGPEEKVYLLQCRPITTSSRQA